MFEVVTVLTSHVLDEPCYNIKGKPTQAVCAELTDANLCYLRGVLTHQMSEGEKKRQHPRLDQAPADRVEVSHVPGVHWSYRRNRFAARFYDAASSKYSYHFAKTLDAARQFSRTGARGEVDGDDLIDDLIDPASDLDTDEEKDEVEGDVVTHEIDLECEIDAMLEGVLEAMA